MYDLPKNPGKMCEKSAAATRLKVRLKLADILAAADPLAGLRRLTSQLRKQIRRMKKTVSLCLPLEKDDRDDSSDISNCNQESETGKKN